MINFLVHVLSIESRSGSASYLFFSPGPGPVFIKHICVCRNLGGSGPGAVARSDARPTGMRTVTGSILTFVEIGHEIISISILSLPLIKEGQCSVTVYW